VSRRMTQHGDCGAAWEFSTPSWSGGPAVYSQFLFKEDGAVPLVNHEDGVIMRYIKGTAGDIWCSCPDFVCRHKVADILDASMGCKHTRCIQKNITARIRREGIETALAA
jgi:hypothetical protein